MSSNKHTDVMNRLMPLYLALNDAKADLELWRSYPPEGNECGQGCCGYTAAQIGNRVESLSNDVDDARNSIMTVLKALF